MTPPRSSHSANVVRAAWRLPAADPAPPCRVWRDWLLVAVVPVLVIVEATLRPELPWRWWWAGVLIAASPALLWRRQRPLESLAVTYGATTMTAALTGAQPELVSTGYVLVFLYALARWGSGQALVCGTAILLTGFVISLIQGPQSIGDVIGSVTVVAALGALGFAFRWRAISRDREFERVKLLEREALARDLHDTVAHHVSAIVVQAQAGSAVAAHDPAATAQILEAITREARSTLTEMRSIVRVLRRDDDPELAPVPDIGSLRALASSHPTSPTVEVEVTGDEAGVPPAVAAIIFRIAQESVTNARRHARSASRIQIRLSVDDAGAALSVTNDGDHEQPAPAGFGITGMRERAALLGGALTSEPSPHGGWHVVASLPRHEWPSEGSAS